MKKKIEKIRNIEHVLKEQFDVRKIIINIGGLIHNQKNIFKKLKMTPEPINVMQDRLDELSKEEDEENQRNDEFSEDLES